MTNTTTPARNENAHARNVREQQAMMKSLNFGIEIETIGLARPALAAKLAAAFPGARAAAYGSYGNSWAVTLADGREWKLVNDGSLSDSRNHAEIVSPILTYADVDMLQTVIRVAREAGAKVDRSCGIHVHVDGAKFGADPKGLVRLARLVYSQEDILLAALKVQQARIERYTRRVNEQFIQRLDERPVATMADVQRAWYGRDNAQAERYDGTRYHGLNLNSFFYRGTVEFRYFEGSLHAGKVKANVQLCLAFVAMALRSKVAVARKRVFNPASAKYDFRVLMLRLGMIGDEFKTARLHLLEGLGGDGVWKVARRTAQATPPAPPADVAAPAPAAPPAPPPPAPAPVPAPVLRPVAQPAQPLTVDIAIDEAEFNRFFGALLNGPRPR